MPCVVQQFLALELRTRVAKTAVLIRCFGILAAKGKLVMGMEK